MKSLLKFLQVQGPVFRFDFILEPLNFLIDFNFQLIFSFNFMLNFNFNFVK